MTDKVHEHCAPESLSVEQVVISRAALDHCSELLAAMPPAQARVAYLRYACQWATKEIAEYLRISQSTVRVHLANAFALLKAEVAHELPFDLDLNDPKEGA